MKFSLLKKDKYSNNFSINECIDGCIIKKDYFSIILLIKVIVASIYAFGLGYSLFYFGDDFIKIGIKSLLLLIPLYFILEFPYAFFKAILLPNAFNKDIIKLELNPLNINIHVSSSRSISKGRLIFSIIVPFIFLAILPTIISYILEFNIFLYTIAAASAITSVPDLVFLTLIVIDDSIGKNLIVTPFEYRNYNTNSTEILADLDEDSNLEYKDEYCYQLLETINKDKIKKEIKVENKDTEYIKEIIFNVDE